MKKNFVLQPPHKFFLLATAVATEEPNSEWHVAAQCAVTTPSIQKDLVDNGYITVDPAFMPSLTQRGLTVVQQMLNPAKPIEQVVIPYAVHHFNAIPDNQLLQLVLNSIECVKGRTHKSANFAEKCVGNTRLQVAYKYLKSLSPVFEAEEILL